MDEIRLAEGRFTAGGARVLIVVDDPAYAVRLTEEFRRYGYCTDIRSSSDWDGSQFDDTKVDAIFWWVRRGDTTAWEQVKALRDRRARLPLVMQLGEGGETEMHAMLAAGADVCLTGAREETVVAVRVGALLRRVEWQSSLTVFEHYRLLRHHHRMERCNLSPHRWVHFSEQEFLLAELLAENAGETVGHELLDSVVWGRDMSGDENVRYRLVGRVKRRVAVLGGLTLTNEHGSGYRLALSLGAVSEG